MDIVTHQKRRVQLCLTQKRITKAELARRAGVPETTLTTATNEDWDPRSETLGKLVAALDALERDGKPRPRQSAANAAA